MNKRERVLAAIKGQQVDRVPYSFWLHNFLEEHSAEALANETIRLYKRFDWDFLKPQSRPYCFTELWGQEFLRSPDKATMPIITKYALETADDIRDLKAVNVAVGALAEQVEAYKLVRQGVGNDVPIVGTVFAPMMTAMFMVKNGPAEIRRLMTERPDALEEGLAVIADALSDYSKMCIDNGMDGVFYATTAATRLQMTPEEFQRFQAPFDKQILGAASEGCFNIMHMCGDQILADSFVEYPVDVFSWATTSGNPSLTEMHNKTGKAVLGGLPGKPSIGSMSIETLKEKAARSLAEMQGRFHLLGPDCSINPDTAEALIAAVGDVVRQETQQA